MAPLKAAVFPLVQQPELNSHARAISTALTRAGLANTVDTTGMPHVGHNFRTSCYLHLLYIMSVHQPSQTFSSAGIALYCTVFRFIAVLKGPLLPLNGATYCAFQCLAIYASFVNVSLCGGLLRLDAGCRLQVCASPQQLCSPDCLSKGRRAAVFGGLVHMLLSDSSSWFRHNNWKEVRAHRRARRAI